MATSCGFKSRLRHHREDPNAGSFLLPSQLLLPLKMKKRMQSLPARILFLLFLLFDADELVVLVFDGLLDISVCDCLAHGEDGSTLFVGYFSAVYTVQCLESFLDGGFAMIAHHAFNLNCFFHLVFLLWEFYSLIFIIRFGNDIFYLFLYGL